jgi:hypothetical protein
VNDDADCKQQQQHLVQQLGELMTAAQQQHKCDNHHHQQHEQCAYPKTVDVDGRQQSKGHPSIACLKD